MNTIDLLMNFNLTKQEAQIYLALLTEGDLTGYEAAKVTGISRSNIYTALAGLVEKGAANVMEGTAARYTGVPLDEFCGNAIRQMQQYKRELLTHAPDRRKEVDGYITVKGEQQILHKMKNMINAASERIYISVSGAILQILQAELESASARGIRLVILTDAKPGFTGATVYIANTPQHQIRLITDSASVLTGDIADGSGSTCLFSMKKNLIDLFKDALKNEIKLLEYEKGAGR